MAAKDHLQPKLFHGSAAHLLPGDTINPGYNDSSYPLNPGAYATSNYKHAEDFSRLKAQSEGVLFSPIYEVEHLTHHSDPKNIMGRKAEEYGYARDEKGFRIKKVAGWANQDFDSPYYDDKRETVELDVI